MKYGWRCSKCRHPIYENNGKYEVKKILGFLYAADSLPAVAGHDWV